MAISTLLFMTPVAMHRMLFREGLKDFVVRHTDTLIGTGLFFLGTGIVGGVVLVLDVLLRSSAAFWIGGVLALLGVSLWVLLPLSQRRRGRREDAVEKSGTPSPTDRREATFGRPVTVERPCSAAPSPSRGHVRPPRHRREATFGRLFTVGRPRSPVALGAAGRRRSAPDRRTPATNVSGSFCLVLAEAAGFEPARGFILNPLSRRAH